MQRCSCNTRGTASKVQTKADEASAPPLWPRSGSALALRQEHVRRGKALEHDMAGAWRECGHEAAGIKVSRRGGEAWGHRITESVAGSDGLAERIFF